MLNFLLRLYGLLAVGLPSVLVKTQVPRPRFLSNETWIEYLLKHFDKPGIKILEIGSRNVCGNPLGGKFLNAHYVGFDFYPGDNVDITGDAHNLSHYFPDESFDLIFSSAVFEHLYAPWIVSEQISLLLKPGGHVFVETHFSYTSHERPWHFFQFSDMALRVLFNRSLGFEVIDAGMDNPMFAFFSAKSIASLRFRPIVELYCHSSIFCKKVQKSSHFDWKTLNQSDLVGDSCYPTM